MKTPSIWHILILLLGEALIIATFFVLGPHTAQDILVLNIVVASMAWLLAGYGLLSQVLGTRESVEKNLPGLGLRAAATFAYAVLAIGGMLVMNVFMDYTVAFKYQALYQGALIFLYICAAMMSVFSSTRAGEVEERETAMREGKRMMQQTVQQALLMAQTKGVPDITARLTRLRDELRYVSPNTSEEAQQLEDGFCNAVSEIYYGLSDAKAGAPKIETAFNQAFTLLNARKALATRR